MFRVPSELPPRLADQHISDINIEPDARVFVGSNTTYNINQGNISQLLPYVPEASFDSSIRENEDSCLPGTRNAVLQQLHAWIEGNNERIVFWLAGLAGTGKSTIARTIARDYSSRGYLVTSFFFSRGGGDRGHAGKFVGTIALQLAHKSPQFRDMLCEAISNDEGIVHKGIHDQWKQLIVCLLSKLDIKAFQGPLVIIIDALDECGEEGHIRQVIQCLTNAQHLQGRFRVIITSRPEDSIEHWFLQARDDGHEKFVLHDIPRSDLDNDISLYLKDRLDKVRERRFLQANWPGEHNINGLVKRAAGLFIWAATAYKYIDEGKGLAAKRLSRLLMDKSSTTKPEEQLNRIYSTVLESAIGTELNDSEKEYLYGLLRKGLGALVMLFSPLSITSMVCLLYPLEIDIDSNVEEADELKSTIMSLRSILDIPDNSCQPARLLHPSFRDYLLDRGRCGADFKISEADVHLSLSRCCIQLMSKDLRKDICNLQSPGILNSEIDNDRVKENLSDAVQYACQYWIAHLQCAKDVRENIIEKSDENRIHDFLKTHLLHWLEALSLMKKGAEGISALTVLESTLKDLRNPELYHFIYDAKRFAMYNKSIIQEAPLQTYCSAAIFAPEKSVIRQQFKREIPKWFNKLPAVRQNWSSLELTLEGHSGPVWSVAFSNDKVASGSQDQTVKIWNMASGQLEATLEGHSGNITSVVFSPNNKIISGSSDRTIRIWNAISGKLEATLKGHSGTITSVIFTPKGDKIISGSSDQTIKVWNSASGQLEATLEGHSRDIISVAFSLNNKIISGSSDQTIRIWNAISGKLEATLKGHSGEIISVIFSPMTNKIASTSYSLTNSTINIWDMASGQLETTLKSRSYITSIAFSQKGDKIVSRSTDGTIRIWNTVNGQLEVNLETYSCILNVIFLSKHDKVISGCFDGTIRIWDIASKQQEVTLKSHYDQITSVAFSPKADKLVSTSKGNTMRILDIASGQQKFIFNGLIRQITCVTFSPKGDKIGSVSGDGTIRIWDTATGQLENTLSLRFRAKTVQSIAFSPNGDKIVSYSSDRTIRIWNIASRSLSTILKCYFDSIQSVVFSPKGDKVISVSFDRTVKIWDAVSGQLEATLGCHCGCVLQYDDLTMKIWDMSPRYPNCSQSMVFLSSSDVPETSSLFSMDESNSWITKNGARVLHIPFDFKPGKLDIMHGSIALVGSSGSMVVLSFLPDADVERI